jgi:hypothetical protein
VAVEDIAAATGVKTIVENHIAAAVNLKKRISMIGIVAAVAVVAAIAVSKI